jgi:mannose-6-phosphate isomerase-like protein (cupin superfamily)
MTRKESLISMVWAGCLLTAAGTQSGFADDATAKTQHFSAAQLKALAGRPVDGIAANKFLSGPGSTVYIIYRDKKGETEVHMAFNDILVVKSGHAKITVGGQVAGNRQTEPTEWRGGDISGGTEYSLNPGDVLFIPAGLPHQVLVTPKSSITYVLVKTPK